MPLLRKLKNGFEIHGGRMTKEEENDFYSRIAEGPKIILRTSKVKQNRTEGPAATEKETTSKK